MRARRGRRREAVSNFILISIGVGLIYWFVECLIDVFVFYEGNQALHVLTRGDFSHRLLSRLSSPDPNELWMRLLLMLVFVLFGVFVHQTVARRRAAEAGLQGLTEDLEQRVEERTRELEAANQELKAFNYSVSHDLRSPLRAITGFSRTLLEGHADRLDAEGRDRLGAIHTSAQRMGRLIDDLLGFSWSARRQMRCSDVDMRELAAAVYDELLYHQGPTNASEHGTGTLGSERTVRLELKDLPRAEGDLAMLREVLANLLSNALKFTRPREVARIEVRGWTDPQRAENVYTVRDNGVGFDMRYAEKLFEVFQRLHSEDEFEGSGVGLAVVRRVVQRHGGRVWAEGAVDRGATFAFTLPARSRATWPAAPGAPGRRPAHRSADAAPGS